MRLDAGELGRADLILLLVREARDQIAHLFDAVACHRMSAERLRYSARLLLLLGLELFKKGYHRMRVVPGGPHILSAEPIGFFLGAARELEEGQRNRQSGRLPNREAAYPAEEDQRDRAVVEQIGLRRLLDAVSGRDGPGLVRYH